MGINKGQPGVPGSFPASVLNPSTGKAIPGGGKTVEGTLDKPGAQTWPGKD